MSAPLEPTGTVRVRYGYRPVVVAPRQQMAADYARAQGKSVAAFHVVTEAHQIHDLRGPVILLDGESNHFPIHPEMARWLTEHSKRGDITITRAFC